MLFLIILQLCVITSSIGHHWKCIRCRPACVESRDPWVWGQKELHFWNPEPQFIYTLCKFNGSIMKVIQVICQNNDLLNLNSCLKWRIMWPTLPPSFKTLLLFILELWVITFPIGHPRESFREGLLLLKMHGRPLHMHRITWPVSRGSKTVTFLKSWTQI